MFSFQLIALNILISNGLIYFTVYFFKTPLPKRDPLGEILMLEFHIIFLDHDIMCEESECLTELSVTNYKLKAAVKEQVYLFFLNSILFAPD